MIDKHDGPFPAILTSIEALCQDAVCDESEFPTKPHDVVSGHAYEVCQTVLRYDYATLTHNRQHPRNQ